MMLRIIIIAIILLTLVIIGHAIYILARYLFDTSLEIHYADIKYKYRRILIYIADRLYRKDGGFWMKFNGRSLIEKLPKDAIFIFENPHPEIQFSSNLENIAWVNVQGKLIQSNKEEDFSIEEEVGSPWGLFYGRNFWGKGWSTSMTTENLTIVLSIKDIIQWLIGNEFVLLDYKNEGWFVPEYNQEKIKKRYNWEDSRKRIIKFDKAIKSKQYAKLVSVKDKIYRVTDERFLNEIYDVLFYCPPLQSISSIECHACQKKYKGKELKGKYYKGSYWNPETREYTGISYCLRFISCPHQHIIISIFRYADLGAYD